jgi:hypothetical protein
MPDKKGFTVDELIKELKKYPKDAKVVIPHFYRTQTGGLRNEACNVNGITPCFELDTNKLMFVSINMDIDIKGI